MASFLKTFSKDNKQQFLKYKKYIKENDWTESSINRNENNDMIGSKYYFIKDISYNKEIVHEGKESEYKVQQKIVKTIADRLKFFAEYAMADIGNNIHADRLVKNMSSIIDIHLARIDKHISNSTVLEEKEEVEADTKKTQRDYKSEEIEFDNLLYKDRATIKDSVNKLDLERDNKDNVVDLLDNKKAPLSMRKSIEEHFPDVNKIVSDMKIDFHSKPKNEMLINIENPPKWNPDKHYFEQDKKTLQFYVDEFKKIENGIVVDGQFISGWLYTHLNVFKTYIPKERTNPNTGEVEIKDAIMCPPLRDNEWFIIQDNYLQAKKENKIMFLCATRRAAKTTLISSYLQWHALKGGKTLVVAGGSSEDLGHIEKDFKVTLLNADPAFHIPNISNNWKKEVKLGLKKRGRGDINPCTLNIINLEGGTENASEKLAGFTPDCFVLDECMKAPFKDQLDGALPAFESFGKLRFVPILSGTGGNSLLSKDAHKVLKNPEQNRILSMNWDALERGVEEEFITWKRRKFGTFLPGQMSIVAADLRVEKTLGEYLGREGVLDKIKIQVTGWKKSLERFTERRLNLNGDKPSLTKEKVYFPLDPEDIFLSGKSNPFPREEIRNYINRLTEEGDVGKKVILEYNAHGEVEYALSDKEYPQVPHSGGFADAPCTLYADPLPNAGWGHYICSLDDYKAEESLGDSVGSFVILDRMTKEIVATYHSRPDPHNEFYRQGLLLMEMYAAECFMENADMGYKTFLDSLELTDKYLVKAFDMTGDFNLQSASTRKFGWTPTPSNKSNLFNFFVRTMRSQEIYEDSNGKRRVKWGFEKTKDLRILEEMMQYKDGGNFDTIISTMASYFYDYYLTSQYGAPDPPMTEEERERERLRKLMTKQKMTKKRGMFPKSRRSMFPATRRKA